MVLVNDVISHIFGEKFLMIILLVAAATSARAVQPIEEPEAMTYSGLSLVLKQW